MQLVRWSPDGMQLAVLIADPPTTEQQQARRLKADAYQPYADWTYAHVHLIPFVVGPLQPPPAKRLTTGPFHVLDVDWVPSGDGLVVAYQPTPMFAARGYAILRCNPRGSSGRGQAFRFANLGDWGGSSLTGDGDIPVESSADQIPSTWVPARNHIFLAVASGFAEVVGASAIYIGVSQVDYSGYPDCRGEFLDAFQRAADLASKGCVEEGVSIPVLAPFLHLPKSGVVRLGLTLGVDYSLTWSCYQGGDVPCGVCDSCRLRAAAFAQVGQPDPLLSHAGQ